MTKINYFQQGNQLKQDKKFDQAITAYQKALSQNANFYCYHHNLGEVLEQQGKLDQAITHYRRATELNPNSACSYNKLGEVFAKSGKWGLAIQSYKAALKIKPNFDIFQKNLDEALAQKKGKNQAGSSKNEVEILSLEETKQSKHPPGTYEYYLELGDKKQWNNQVDQAIHYYVEAIRANPTQHSTYFRIIDYILYQNDILPESLRKIEQICRQSIEENHATYTARFLLGRSLTDQGKIKEAQECFQLQIYKKYQNSNPTYVKNHWEKGKLQGPSFIIIGAPKCGTTTLFEYINQHPQVLDPIYKETRYFDTKLSQYGIDYYFAHFPLTPEDNSFITGESDPGYIYTKNGPQKIYKLLPNIKLILIFRNPVDRTISQYHHWVRSGKEPRSLESAIQSELKLIQEAKEFNRQVMDQSDHGYLGKSLYYYFIQEWLNVFPREQLLILTNEDLDKNAAVTMKRVYKFLDVEDYTTSFDTRHNVGTYSAVNQDIYDQLSEFYQPYNHRLEEILGMQFNW
jgi:tetratricopeptide (TPR) repeat protein